MLLPTTDVLQIVVGVVVAIAVCTSGALAVWYLIVARVVRDRRLRLAARRIEDFELGTTSGGHERPLAAALARVNAFHTMARELGAAAQRVKIPAPPIADYADERSALAAVSRALAAPGVGLLAAGADATAPMGWAVLGELNIATIKHAASHLDLADLKELGELAQAIHDYGVAGVASHVAGAMFEGAAAGHALTFADSGLSSLVHGAEAAGEIGHHLGGAIQHLDAGDAHGHFPVITMLLSAAREADLLTNEKTTVERAAAHVAIDTGATFAGGTLGLKGGALLGTAILPGVGTLVGGLIGAVGGSIAGKLAAGEVKAIPLREAHGTYQTMHAQGTGELNVSASTLAQQARASALRQQREYDREATAFSSRVRAVLPRGCFVPIARDLRYARQAAAEASSSQASDILDAIPQDRGWHRVLRVDVGEAAGLLRARVAEATDARARALQTPTTDSLDELAQLSWPGCCGDALKAAAAKVDAETSSATVSASRASADLAQTLRGGVQAVVHQVERDSKAHRRLSESWRTKLGSQAKDVARLRAALGG